MVTTSIFEMYQIINIEHSDPHSVLGMHEIYHNGKDYVAVRVFMPSVKHITIIDKNDDTKAYTACKIHEDGFFEAVIEDREKWFPYLLNIEYYDGTKKTISDKYSFEPTISEYDRYLFGAGNHYEIYNKLGAKITEVDGIKGVSFAVWAPNAKSICIIGSFNYWDGRADQMRRLGSSGVWELFIPTATELDRYKFQIKTQYGEVVNKSDPYAFYSEVRPQTASIVYDINKYKWKDSRFINKRNTTDYKKSPVNIYEVHLGSWKRNVEEKNRFLTYTELADELVAYVKQMGYTHIELLPIAEHPFDGSWGYQVTGYYSPTSRYGTPDEFKYFVDRCHANGIGVILDWVPAHFPKDIHGLGRFDGTALYEHQDSRLGEHRQWGTYIFNFGCNEVRNFLIANALFWIKQYHLDGLRVDAVASLIYLDFCREEGDWLPNKYGGRENIEAVEFLKHMNSVIAGAYPNVMIIAEESTSWEGVTRKTEYNGLGFSLKWNMGWMNDFTEYIKKDSVYKKYHHNLMTFSLTYAYSENYVLVLSHDEVVHLKGSMINKMPGDLWQKFANLRTTYGYMYGHPGKKLLFMGNDIAQYREWSEDRSLDWDLLEAEKNIQLNMYMKDLFKVYNKYPALWKNDNSPSGFSWIECNDSENSIFSFARYGDEKDNILLFVVNFTPNTTNRFRVGVPFSGSYKEILNSDDEKYGGSGVVNKTAIKSEEMPYNGYLNSIEIQLPPLGTAVFALTPHSLKKLLVARDVN